MVMNRIVLYTVTDNGWVVPTRKAYKKARFRRKMGRYHDWHAFFKNGRKKLPKEAENMSEPTCFGCKYLADTFGNYVECKKTAETGTHMFVDWYYWNDGSPDECPLKAKDDEQAVKLE